MASCEHCKTTGIDPRTIVVAQREGQHILIGPCCYVPQEKPETDPTQVSYGLEVSSNYGVLAYVEYGGVKLEFRKTPQQVQQLYTKYVEGQASHVQH
jgi:hypothetical protein